MERTLQDEDVPTNIHRRSISSGRQMSSYDNHASSLVIAAALSGRPSLLLHSSHGRLAIDLVKMKELNLDTGHECDIAIEICWDMKKMVSKFLAFPLNQRHEILTFIVEKLRNEDNVQKFIKSSPGGVPISNFSYLPNPFISNQHIMYTSFLESLECAVQRNPEGLEKILAKIRDSRCLRLLGEADDTVILGFHGTNHECMDNIMQRGMDPSLRRSSGNTDWFATIASTSIKYTLQKTPGQLIARGGTKLLIFLLIKETTTPIQNGVVTIMSSKNQLPIGVVTFGTDNGRSIVSSKDQLPLQVLTFVEF